MQVCCLQALSCSSIELSLKSRKDLHFGSEFSPTFDNSWFLRSVLGGSILGETKESKTLAKRWLYKSASHSKLLNAPELVLPKVWHIHFYINVSWPKSNTSTSFHQSWRFQHHLNAQILWIVESGAKLHTETWVLERLERIPLILPITNLRTKQSPLRVLLNGSQ